MMGASSVAETIRSSPVRGVHPGSGGAGRWSALPGASSPDLGSGSSRCGPSALPVSRWIGQLGARGWAFIPRGGLGPGGRLEPEG
jgi:hypothetical protein